MITSIGDVFALRIELLSKFSIALLEATVTAARNNLACVTCETIISEGPNIPKHLLHLQQYTDRPAMLSARGGMRGTRVENNSPGPNHCGDAEWLREAPKRPNNVTRSFVNTVNLLPKYFRFKHGGDKLASCPRRHLTSLRPCSALSQQKQYLVSPNALLDNINIKLHQVPNKRCYNHSLRSFDKKSN